MDYRAQLLALASVYGAATDRSEARVATMACNQGAFFARIRGGATCSVDTYLRIKRWFADHWPPGVGWPAGVDLPDILPKDHAA